MIYFTSDIHFGHANIIRSCGRPFETADEMDEAIIRNWNGKVKPQDEVYILGDVTMKGPDFAKERLLRLNGTLYLVKGNHDHFVNKNKFDPDLFGWVKDYYQLKVDNRRFILFHYPITEWNYRPQGSIHLHGHQHNKQEYNLKNRENGILRYDVGMDANNFTPVSLEEIVRFFGVQRNTK
ncbi:MAG: metallophosphoesterase family protein [Lachnospiraceae bacterium]|nr:metallophosphoesterase family protein [Lachnospiraceae bacterium]